MSTVLDRWCDQTSAAVVRSKDGLLRRSTTGEVLPPEGGARVLRSWIYHDVHTAGSVADHETLLDDPAALRVLAALDLGCWCAPGWHVDAPEGSGWLVSRAGVRLVVTSQDLPRGSRPGSGTTSVLVPRLRPQAMPGWAAFVSRRGPGPDPDTRVYAHLRTLDVLPALLAVLDGLGLAWRAKVSTRRRGTERPDVFVVYIAAQDLTTLTAALQPPGVAAWLTDPVPGFSHRLAAGLAASTDPPGWSGGSFGAQVSHRAALALLADGDVRAALAPCCVPLPASPRSITSSRATGSHGGPAGHRVAVVTS